MNKPLEIRGDSFAGRYKRTNDYPIDSTDVWNTEEEARVYARNNDTETYVPYAGQIISVLDKGTTYKLVKHKDIPETDGRKHYDLSIIGSNNDNDDRYVRKDIAETIKFLMTFLEGINAKGTSTLEEIKLLKNIVSHNFANGSTGFGIFQDEQGNYHLDIDFVNIRRKLTVSEIQVQQSSYIGGKQWNTAAGIICSAVEDKGTAWRCFFNTTDAEGRTVRNTFAAGDQALCETFNLDKQAGGALGDHMYWRLVVAADDNYIDLSKTDCITASDAPQVGDNIVQLGNRTDPSRQGAICWDSVTDGGPYVRVYDGINSYHLPQPKIDLNPTESIINARFVSTATGKDVDDVLDGMQVNMDLIKQQTDREYTMWFFEYVPTLSNIPASEWTTDALKVMHEQDMFYNRASGLAYRFEKSGDAWVWNSITDQQTVKALENAAKAQDTADGKRRVFVAQPTNAQAYDVGDLWTNATYPASKPYTYQNDSLVCKTAKAAGAAFSIAHWKSSSTATTAYLENLGDRIVLGVTESDKKIEAVKELAESGISSATGIANDAISGLKDAMEGIGDLSENLSGLLDDINGVNKTLTEHTTAIQLTKESIALLAQGKEKDADGNVVSVSKGGLVTTAYFNTLFSERVEFDEDGHIINVSKSGLVTTADFSELFAQKADADGYVKKAYIQTFITELPDGRFQSNALVSADLIRFNGKIVANDTFVVDENGDLTLNRITANNGVFRGRVEAEEGYFRGKVTTAINGKRIEVDPSKNSIRMYNSDDLEVGSIEFIEKTFVGITITEPRITLKRKYKSRDGTIMDYGKSVYTSDSILISTFVAAPENRKWIMQLNPTQGLHFWREGEAVAKIYPPG